MSLPKFEVKKRYGYLNSYCSYFIFLITTSYISISLEGTTTLKKQHNVLSVASRTLITLIILIEPQVKKDNQISRDFS